MCQTNEETISREAIRNLNERPPEYGCCRYQRDAMGGCVKGDAQDGVVGRADRWRE